MSFVIDTKYRQTVFKILNIIHFWLPHFKTYTIQNVNVIDLFYEQSITQLSLLHKLHGHLFNLQSQDSINTRFYNTLLYLGVHFYDVGQFILTIPKSMQPPNIPKLNEDLTFIEEQIILLNNNPLVIEEKSNRRYLLNLSRKISGGAQVNSPLKPLN
jgi:hypothetical protein